MATLEVALSARGYAASMSRDVIRPNAQGAASSQKFASSVERSEAVMGRAGGVAGKFARQLAGLVTVFTAFRAVRASATLIGKFEEQIVLVGAVSGATAVQLEQLEATARMFGASTRFSATEAAEGLLFLARAGFDVQSSIAALPATLNLAQVGMISLGQAADFASNIVAQFGLSADETSRVVDSLVIASNRANTSVSQAAEAMKFAGTVLGQLGIQVETTANLIGVLGDRGIQASQAGTNLRAVFLKLQAPTSAGAAALKRYGLSMQDIDFRTNDTADVFERLLPLLKDTQAAVDIFGIRNVSAAQTIALSTDRLRELEQAQRDNVGEAERVAKAVDDTLIGAFKNLGSAVQESVLQLGDSGLAGVFRGTIDLATDVVRIMTGMTNAQNQASQSAVVLAGALFGLGTALRFVAFVAGVTAIAGFVSALKSGALLVGKLATAVALLGSPVGLITTLLFSAATTIGIYSAGLVEASNETRRLATETFNAQNRVVSGLGSMERAAFDLKRAIEFDDSVGEVAALNTQAKLLEDQFFKLTKEAEAADKAIRNLSASEREGIGVGPGFNANFEARFKFKDIAKVIPEADARALAEKLGLEFEIAIKAGGNNVSRAAYIEAIDNAIRGLREAAKAKSAERIEIKVDPVLTPEQREQKAAGEALLDFARALDQQGREAGKSSEEVDRLRFAQEALAIATAGGADDAQRLTDIFIKRNDANREANELAEQARRDAALKEASDERTANVQERLQAQSQQAIDDLKFEITLVGKSNVERQKAIFNRQIEAVEAGNTADEIVRLNKEYGETLDRYEELGTKGADSLAIQRELAGSIGDSLRSGLEDAIIELDNLEEVGKRVFEEIRRAAVRAAIASAFGPQGSGGGFLSRFFGGDDTAEGEARGGAFGPGGVALPGFARGGLISQPSLISSAAGLRPVAEREAEAVMPLRRTSGGRLGVEVANPDAGGGGKAPIRVTMNINGVRDADSFKRNQRQITQGVSRSLNRRGA